MNYTDYINLTRSQARALNAIQPDLTIDKEYHVRRIEQISPEFFEIVIGNDIGQHMNLFLTITKRGRVDGQKIPHWLKDTAEERGIHTNKLTQYADYWFSNIIREH